MFFIPSLILNITNNIRIGNLNKLIITGEKARLELIRNTANFHINEFISDIAIIAKSETINRYINSRKPSLDWVYVVKEFVSVSKELGDYDQIRFLNIDGQEVVRVDYNNGIPAIIPRSKLQNKSNRYYFKETLKQLPGQVYISPLDLNMEHGKIEIPHKPMIRIGTNVYHNTEKKGMVLVNYYGEKILTRIKNLFSESNSEYMMLNKDGFWLLSKSDSDLWGFMFNNNKSLAVNQPQIWREINSQLEGEVRQGEYIYLHNTIFIGLDKTKLKESDNHWKVVTKFKPIKLFTSEDPYLYQSIVFHLLFFITALFSSWLIIFSSSQKAHISKLTAINHIIFNKISTGIFITDKKNKIVSVNPAMSEITGYSEDELVGKDPSVFSSGYHDEHFYKEMWKQLKNTKRWTGEVWNRNKSGNIFPESLSISVVEDNKKRLQYYIAIFMDITKQKNTEAKLQHKAHYDYLTELPNREYFKETLTQTIKDKESFTLFFIDLDKFKDVNDTLGHTAGDKLLIEAARRFSLCVRETDFVARLGGDEFTMILKNMKNKSDIEFVAKKILKQMEKVFKIDGHDIFISSSIGITLYPEDAIDCETLLKNADEAMYYVKKSGRDAFSFFVK